MKKYIVMLGLLSISIVFASQFIAPRPVGKVKKSASKLQEECCQLSLDIQQIAISSSLRLFADLNELIICIVAGCVEGNKKSLLVSSSKEELQKIVHQLKTFKETMMKTNKDVASFIIQLKQ